MEHHNPITIALDCMGFENDVAEAVNAAAAFVTKFADTNFILFGNERVGTLSANLPRSKFVHTSQIVTMEDTPISARRKTDSSMWQAIACVARGEAHTVLSAGSTPAYVGLTFAQLGKIRPEVKPGFMSWVPTADERGFYFLDVGAATEFSGTELYGLALMASEVAKTIRKIAHPRVGLMNIGTEAHKGFSYHHDAHVLMQQDKSFNYLGYVEPRGLISGGLDVLVSEGYGGNLVLKALEGSLLAMSRVLKKGFQKNRLAGLFSLGIIKRLKHTFDYKNNAGALVVGLKKPAVKTHGSADAQQFYSALEFARQTALLELPKRFYDVTAPLCTTAQDGQTNGGE